MFQFWRCLTNRMTHHPAGPAMADHSPFTEPSYQALSRQDAGRAEEAHLIRVWRVKLDMSPAGGNRPYATLAA